MACTYRYFIYVHYAFTGVDKPTSPFYFFVNDGSGGFASSSGASQILFQLPDGEIVQGDNNAGLPDDDGSGNGGSGNGKGNKSGGCTTKTTTAAAFTTALLTLVVWSSLFL